MSKVKVEKKSGPQIMTRTQFEACVDEIARLDVTRQKMEVDLKKRHQEIDDLYGNELDEVKSKIASLMDSAAEFFTAHQVELCKSGQRQGETKISLFGIRTGMPKFVKKVRTALKDLAKDWFSSDSLREFVRTTPEIDQQAVIALWKDDYERYQTIIPKTVKVTQEDSFWVEPKADNQVD